MTAALSLLDPLAWMPDEVKQRLLDGAVESVARLADKALCDKAGRTLRRLKSDAAFQERFAQGVRRASEQFIREYTPQDEDLVAALAASPELWQAQSVRRALLDLAGRPGSPPDPEQWQALARHFDDVLPQRVNRERVDRAVAYFVRCLAEQVWHLPEIRPIYELQVQRITAERAGAMVQELHALRGEVRETLLALIRAQPAPRQLAAAKAPVDLPRVYHNLPQPDYVRFIGREAELADICSLLSSGNRAWVIVIDGIGGIGKSTLALEVAHRYLREHAQLPEAERFQAIIWASAKSTVLTADGIAPRRQITRTLDDIYATIAAALEREDLTRAREEVRDALFCRALAQQRTLLILDNLETIDDERVNAFLRELAAPTKCIVTTRHRIDVAYPIRLQEMPRADGLALIAQECAKKEVTLDRAAADRLYDRTGGVPLAITWSVAQMGYGHSVEAVLRRLGDSEQDISRFCFAGAMERIRGRPAQALVLALALFADDASREALGFVADLPAADRDEGLVDLERLSLVNHDGDRFRMLPLTKGYALAELRADPRRSTLEERWIGYYCELSTRYGDAHWNWTNYDWLLAEGENILALVAWAVREARGTVVLALTQPVMRYLDVRGRWNELFEYGEMFHRMAQAEGDQRVEAWICTHWLAWLLGETAGVEKARSWAMQGMVLYEALSDMRGFCLARLFLSRALRRGGHFAESEREAQASMQLARDIGYGDGVAVAHDQLGKIARDQGQWAEARERFAAALAWYEEPGGQANLDVTFRMNVWANLGWVEFQLGNHAQGKELCERSLRALQWIGVSGYATLLQCYLGRIELALGNEERAAQYAREALHSAERKQLVREEKLALEILDQIGKGIGGS